MRKRERKEMNLK